MFCDLQLRGLPGAFALAHLLRANSQLAQLHLVGTTTMDTPEYHLSGAASDFDEIFEKPLNFDQIEALMRKYWLSVVSRAGLHH